MSFLFSKEGWQKGYSFLFQTFSWTWFQSLLKCLLPRCWIQFLLHEFWTEQSGKTLCGVSTHFIPYTGLSNTKTTFQWESKAHPGSNQLWDKQQVQAFTSPTNLQSPGCTLIFLMNWFFNLYFSSDIHWDRDLIYNIAKPPRLKKKHTKKKTRIKLAK